MSDGIYIDPSVYDGIKADISTVVGEYESINKGINSVINSLPSELRSGISSVSLSAITGIYTGVVSVIDRALKMNEDTEKSIILDISNISEQDILLLGRGPIRKEFLTEEDYKQIIIEKYKLQLKESLIECGYTVEDAQRIMNQEITPEKLQEEIYQEYLNGDDRRYRKMVEGMIFGKEQFNRAELTQEKELVELELKRLESGEAEDLLYDNKEFYSHIVEDAKYDETGKKYTCQIQRDGKIETIELTAEEMEMCKKTYQEIIEKVSTYEKDKTKKVNELKTRLGEIEEDLGTDKRDFVYHNMAELDGRVTAIDSEIKELIPALATGKLEKNLEALYYYMISENMSYEEASKLQIGYYDTESHRFFLYDNSLEATKENPGKPSLKEGALGLNEDKDETHIAYTFEDLYGDTEEVKKLKQYLEIGENEGKGTRIWIYTDRTKSSVYNNIIIPLRDKNLETSKAYLEAQEKYSALKEERQFLEEKKEEIEYGIEYLVKNGKYILQKDYEEKNKANVDKAVELTDYENVPIIGGFVTHENMGKSEFNGALLSRIFSGECTIGNDLWSDVSGSAVPKVISTKGHSYTLPVGSLTDKYVDYQMWYSNGAISEDEIKIFNYICNTEGYDKGYEYFLSIADDIDKRNVAIRQGRAQEFARSSPFLAELCSLIVTPIEALSNLGKTYRRKVEGLISGSDDHLYLTDEYNSGAMWNRALSQDFHKYYGDFWGTVFDLSHSTSQSMLNMLLVASTGGGAIPSIISSAFMYGIPTFNTTLYDDLEAGIDENWAIVHSLANSLIETGMESCSTANIFNLEDRFNDLMASGGPAANFVKKVTSKLPENMQPFAEKFIMTTYASITQGVVEFNEEYETEMLQGISAILFASDLSAEKQNYELYKKLHPGCSDIEAILFAASELHGRAKIAGIQGFISGAFMGAFGHIPSMGINSYLEDHVVSTNYEELLDTIRADRKNTQKNNLGFKTSMALRSEGFFETNYNNKRINKIVSELESKIGFEIDKVYVRGNDAILFDKYGNPYVFNYFSESQISENAYNLAIEKLKAEYKRSTGPTGQVSMYEFFDRNRSVDQGALKKMTAQEKANLYEFAAEKYRMTPGDVEVIINSADRRGICSYANMCNVIIELYEGNTSQFYKDFGYSLIDDAAELNDSQLLFDLFVYANSRTGNGLLLQNTDEAGNAYTMVNPKFLKRRGKYQNTFDDRNQVFMSNYSNGLNNKMLADFLRSKGSTILESYKPGEVLTKIDSIKSKIESANRGECIISDIGIYSGATIISLKTGGRGIITGGHAVTYVGSNENGIFVRTWGGLGFIPYSQFTGLNAPSISMSTIERR